MAKVKLEFGGELDILNQSELDDSIDKAKSSLIAELSRNVTVQRVVMNLANGLTTIGGPESGFVFAITAINLGAPLVAPNIVSFYVNDVTSGNLVAAINAPNQCAYYAKSQVVIMPGNVIVVSSTVATVMNFAAIQVPVSRIGELVL
ncbi:MAG: hypothetical protein ACREHG_10175 [Candidatus Saccharimonadales bacterium]